MASVNENTVVLQVTTTIDENDAGLGGTGLSLRDAILQAVNNPTQHYQIQLQAGATYNLSLNGSSEHFSNTGDLDVFNSSNISLETINGEHKAIIDASSLSEGDSVFHVRGGSTLNLNNIIITGGQQVDAFGLLGSGGGIFANGNSNINLTNTIVEGNEAAYGAGIYISEGTLTLENSQIIHNRARQEGGGIFARETGSRQVTLNLQDTEISDNTAQYNGGGIGSEGGVKIEINSSTFKNNLAQGGPGGGAIFTEGENSDRAQLTITDSQFEENQAVESDLGGGAIYGEQAEIAIDGSSFVNNSLIGEQDSSGGAIFATDFSTINITQTDFESNKVDVTHGGSGGALASANQTTVDLSLTNFRYNTASDTGGAIRLLGSNHLENVLFEANRATTFAGAAQFSMGYTTTLREPDSPVF